MELIHAHLDDVARALGPSLVYICYLKLPLFRQANSELIA